MPISKATDGAENGNTCRSLPIRPVSSSLSSSPLTEESSLHVLADVSSTQVFFEIRRLTPTVVVVSTLLYPSRSLYGYASALASSFRASW